MSDTQASDIVEHASPLSFHETVERLLQAIVKAGMTLFATIDHAAHAKTIGTTMPPATVLIYGNPKGGTPIMVATPQAALDLPLRVLVRQREDGTVAIVFHPVAAMLHRSGVPEDVGARLEPAQRVLIAALTA
jgi:uncharacterized protein (DUF302 family)